MLFIIQLLIPVVVDICPRSSPLGYCCEWMSTYAVLLFMKLTKSDNCLPANGPSRVSDYDS